MPEPRLPGLNPEEFAAAIAALSSPDVVASPFGDLHFFDGVPLPETVRPGYDALDLMRGIDAFLNAVPGASLVAFRNGSALGGRDVAAGDRNHGSASHIGRTLPHAQHRDDVRHRRCST